MTAWTVRARWLFPVDQPPLRHGTLTMTGDRIVAVEPAGRRTPDLDLGNVGMLPGLVNAHTHLDLGELRGRMPAGEFADWLRAVVAYRRATPPAALEASVRAGAKESLLHGTTLLGDISGEGLSADVLAAGPLRSTVYYELIGLTKSRARQTWQAARDWLKQRRGTMVCRPGLSPHAPYTVRRGLFRLAGRTNDRFLPLALHLAETPEEEQLLTSHSGPLRQLLEALGAWDESGLAPNFAWILSQCSNPGRLALIHSNHFRPSAAHVVHCPRTHAYFGRAAQVLPRLLQAGIEVALGTDSLASNPDLSVLAEMRFVHQRHPDVDGAAIFRMATLAGAAALGWETQVGTLSAGKQADWVTVDLPAPDHADPHHLILEADQRVRDVCIAGQWVVRGGERVGKPADV